MIRKFLWWVLELVDNNHGYSTPIQKRLNPGDEYKISKFKTKEIRYKVGDTVTILETGRHDYLVDGDLGKEVVYQFELDE